MSGKLPLYKYCPVCGKRIPMEAIICLYCEESLLPPGGDDPASPYGEPVMLTTVHPDPDELLDLIDDPEGEGCQEEAEYVRDPEDMAGEEWKREK